MRNGIVGGLLGGLADLASAIGRHPRALAALGVAVVGAMLGTAVTSLAALTGEVRIAFIIIFSVLLPVAIFSGNHLTSKRVWVALLVASLGMFIFRFIYDEMSVPQDQLRIMSTGVFGLFCGITAYLRIRS